MKFIRTFLKKSLLTFLAFFSFQRFNVNITRAISLLIIVGDHVGLGVVDNWKELIDYCDEKNSLVRDGRKLHKRILAP